MITDANGMPVLQPLVDDASTATFNAAFAQIGTGGQTAQPGDIKFSARATAPGGWLIADGAVVSRTTYATLFAAIGTAFGAGNGTTTFGLPDLRERAPVGVSAGSAEFGMVGATFGAKAIALTLPQIPSHDHIIPLMNPGTLGPAGGNDRAARMNSGTVDIATFKTGAAGGGEAHSNIQPSIALTPLIKT